MRVTRRHYTAVTILAVALAVAACSDDGGDAVATTDATTTTQATTTTTTIAAPTTTSTTTTTVSPRPAPTDYDEFRAQPTACGAAQPPRAQLLGFDGPEDQALGDTPVTATITTSCGDIVLELDAATTPATVNSFVFLARSGFFDGTVSHRIVPGFVMQAGDPSGTGRGGPGYTIQDEFPPEGFNYERGVVAMANAGPNTTGSQFFIVLADITLPPFFSVFGRVVDGFETLDALATLPLGMGASGERSVPLETLYLDRVVIGE